MEWQHNVLNCQTKEKKPSLSPYSPTTPPHCTGQPPKKRTNWCILQGLIDELGIIEVPNLVNHRKTQQRLGVQAVTVTSYMSKGAEPFMRLN